MHGMDGGAEQRRSFGAFGGSSSSVLGGGGLKIILKITLIGVAKAGSCLAMEVWVPDAECERAAGTFGRMGAAGRGPTVLDIELLFRCMK